MRRYGKTKAFLTAEISDQVLEDAISMNNVLRAHRKTAADYIVGQISLVFGLVYPESRKIVSEQGYLERIMEFRSINTDTAWKMELIRGKIREFLGAE